eukprot:TRINITY_DN859_c0_g1_i1.p1 TRINITY_DN859_c0_g1~~TRINITY_DN859_c0_g1_i1.p1  ORF type:complete len:168 (-),score=13.65 TRINITY_DN859_c0_g1_i1:492-995(-)
MLNQASTKLVLNKSISETSIPIQRGSRQGDPISGYLFNIAIDVLNHLLLQYIPDKIVQIYGWSIPSLMYCDDTTICVNDPTAVIAVLKVLDEFAKMSGLRINRSKSSIIDNSGSNLKFDIPTVVTVQYLGFKFDKSGLMKQAANFLLSLPDKYHEIQKLRLSPSTLQ